MRLPMHEIGQNQRKKGGWAYITSWAYITYSTVHTSVDGIVRLFTRALLVV